MDYPKTGTGHPEQLKGNRSGLWSRRILLNYFGETSDKSCDNCDVCHTPPKVFDGTIIAQKALSAIMRTNESIGFTVTIDILRGNMSAEVVGNNYNQLKTFAVGRDIPYRDWHDYLLQLLQMGFIEIAYNEDRHIHVTSLGKEVLIGKRKVQLAVINREDFSVKARRQRIKEEQIIKQDSIKFDENKELFEKLRQVRKRIADENHWPAYIVLSDRSLYALAKERPTTLLAFGNTFGIGEHKRDTYGEQFLAVIREYASGKDERPFPMTGIESTPTSKPISHMEEQKQLHANAYAPWTKEEEQTLISYYHKDLSIDDIAKLMSRNHGGIASRIKKLGLERTVKAPNVISAKDSNNDSFVGKANVYHIAEKNTEGLSSTTRNTLELLISGLNPSQIAVKRNLTESTIYGHIVELIEKGILLVSDFVSKETTDRVMAAIEKAQSDKLADIKSLCGNEISYADIKMVLADAMRKNQYFLKNITFTRSSKPILSYNCRIVLSMFGYYLQLNEGFKKLGDIPHGFSFDEGNIFVKKPNNELGYRVYHDIEDDFYLIGYIREEKDRIIFTTQDNKVIIIDGNKRL